MVRATAFGKLVRFPKIRRKVGALPSEGEHDLPSEKDEGNCAPERSGTGTPKKGRMAVYVGEEMRRYVIPTRYVCTPDFWPVMERAREEFGYEQAGGLRIPCDIDEFEEILRVTKESGCKRKCSAQHMRYQQKRGGGLHIYCLSCCT